MTTTTPHHPSDARNRMISFRLSPEEYDRFRDLCFTHGLRSLSELARIALHNFVDNPPPPSAQTSLDARVADLESRLQFLAHELKAIRQTTNNNNNNTANANTQPQPQH